MVAMCEANRTTTIIVDHFINALHYNANTNALEIVKSVQNDEDSQIELMEIWFFCYADATVDAKVVESECSNRMASRIMDISIRIWNRESQNDLQNRKRMH